MSYTHQDYHQLEQDLLQWTNLICNKRLHGTTKKIPQEVFNSLEKQTLIPLANTRYEVLKIEQRKVNNYGHISFKHNFYSVPYYYIGKSLIRVVAKLKNAFVRR